MTWYIISMSQKYSNIFPTDPSSFYKILTATKLLMKKKRIPIYNMLSVFD